MKEKDEKLGQEAAFANSGFMATADKEKYTLPSKGMSKRFYAACAAMHGILSANPEYLQGNVDMPVPYIAAEEAYKYADELLKQENL